LPDPPPGRFDVAGRPEHIEEPSAEYTYTEEDEPHPDEMPENRPSERRSMPQMRGSISLEMQNHGDESKEEIDEEPAEEDIQEEEDEERVCSPPLDEESVDFDADEDMWAVSEAEDKNEEEQVADNNKKEKDMPVVKSPKRTDIWGLLNL